MSWTRGNNTIRPTEDVNAKLMKLEGELTDDQARATLAEFLYHNPAFMMALIARVKMFPMQELIIKGWMVNNYNLAVWGRGCGKSWGVALFAIIWALYNPKNRIVIVSFAFRASRRILEQIERFIQEKMPDGKTPVLISSSFPDGIKRGNDEWILKLPNGATIQCLPLGDGKKIRGTRADTLVVDEFAYLPESIIGEVIRPFLTANNKIREQMENREREDKLIARGAMTEDQRTIIDDFKKVIFLSSACYQFEHMYKRYLDWTGLITDRAREKEIKESGQSYFVSRIGYEAAPDGLLNMKEIEEAKRDISEAMFNREYRAIFEGDSDGYFRVAKMLACSVPDGEAPCLELIGDRGAQYVIGIDQSLSGSEGSDHFAMCVLKIVQRADGKHIGMVVHSYAVAGGNLKDHMLYLYFVMRYFKVVYVVLDASQGDELEFVNSCNQSKMFKEAQIELNSIPGAEFAKDDFTELPKQIRQGYNLTMGRIVHKQPFTSGFLRAANEYLQACFDHKGIMFAGKIGANDGAASSASGLDISMLDSHESFLSDTDGGGKRPMTPTEFIEEQDRLLDLTRKECATIQNKISSLGSVSFDLPASLKKSTGATKARKDSYSALLLANWGLRQYLASQACEVKQGMPDFPYDRGG